MVVTTSVHLAANSVLRRIAGTEPAVLELAFGAYSVSLGRRAATGQFTPQSSTAAVIARARAGVARATPYSAANCSTDRCT
jgi:NADH dehydrogenase